MSDATEYAPAASLVQRQARAVTSLTEIRKQISRPLWIEFEGNGNAFAMSGTFLLMISGSGVGRAAARPTGAQREAGRARLHSELLRITRVKSGGGRGDCTCVRSGTGREASGGSGCIAGDHRQARPVPRRDQVHRLGAQIRDLRSVHAGWPPFLAQPLGVARRRGVAPAAGPVRVRPGPRGRVARSS
jgi:hypothetical protein